MLAASVVAEQIHNRDKVEFQRIAYRELVVNDRAERQCDRYKPVKVCLRRELPPTATALVYRLLNLISFNCFC